MISWKPSIATGVPEIDGQHKALFTHAGRFEAAVTAREPNDRLAELFGFLIQYVAEHFEAEERLMRETDYPGLAEQVSQHADFKRRLHSLVPHWESEGGSTTLLLALAGFLDLGLRDHITSSDQRFADFLRGRRSSSSEVS
jgi:hemerythrin-like metal-binding protein